MKDDLVEVDLWANYDITGRAFRWHINVSKFPGGGRSWSLITRAFLLAMTAFNDGLSRAGLRPGRYDVVLFMPREDVERMAVLATLLESVGPFPKE